IRLPTHEARCGNVQKEGPFRTSALYQSGRAGRAKASELDGVRIVTRHVDGAGADERSACVDRSRRPSGQRRHEFAERRKAQSLVEVLPVVRLPRAPRSEEKT